MPEKRVLKANRSPVRTPTTHLDKLIITGTDEEVTSELRKVFKDDVRSIGKYLSGVLPVGVAKNMVTFIKRNIKEDPMSIADEDSVFYRKRNIREDRVKDDSVAPMPDPDTTVEDLSESLEQVFPAENINKRKQIINSQLFAVIDELSMDLHMQIGRLEDINKGQLYYRMLRILLTPGNESDKMTNLKVLKLQMSELEIDTYNDEEKDNT